MSLQTPRLKLISRSRIAPLACALLAFTVFAGFGGKTPEDSVSPSSSPSPSPSPSSTPSLEPSPLASPIASPSPSPSATSAPSASPRPRPQPSPKVTVTASPSPRAPLVKPSPNPLPEALQKAEATYAQSASMKATFKQMTFSVSTQQKRTSEGTLLVQRPDKIRWETLKPDRSLLVSNGKTAWFYTPPFEEGERGQVIERPAASTHSNLTQALLSGRFSMARDLRVEALSATRFKLTPLHKRAAPGVRSAEILLDPKTHQIRSVTLENTGGNRTEIELESIELGGPMDRKLFEFQAPPNTDRLDPSAENF